MKVCFLCIALALGVDAQITRESLENSQQDGNSWASYGRNYFGWRYSPLAQIKASNVA